MMDMNGLKKILRYLRGLMVYCLEFSTGTETKETKCESDVSWDKERDDKSFVRKLIYWNDNLEH